MSGDCCCCDQRDGFQEARAEVTIAYGVAVEPLSLYYGVKIFPSYRPALVFLALLRSRNELASPLLPLPSPPTFGSLPTEITHQILEELWETLVEDQKLLLLDKLGGGDHGRSDALPNGKFPQRPPPCPTQLAIINSTKYYVNGDNDPCTCEVCVVGRRAGREKSFAGGGRGTCFVDVLKEWDESCPRFTGDQSSLLGKIFEETDINIIYSYFDLNILSGLQGYVERDYDHSPVVVFLGQETALEVSTVYNDRFTTRRARALPTIPTLSLEQKKRFETFGRMLRLKEAPLDVPMHEKDVDYDPEEGDSSGDDEKGEVKKRVGRKDIFEPALMVVLEAEGLKRDT